MRVCFRSICSEEILSGEFIRSVESELGYTLPAAYIELMKIHNGDIPCNTCFPTKSATSCAENPVAITGIAGIGRIRPYSLGRALGSRFMIDEWGCGNRGLHLRLPSGRPRHHYA
ncbi:SMI1/KNR4 family protein [Hymenobacter cyanobacteriorum]|uniref:SMI1/KNR4 family protein n=1 Tax=Hymenobacter cyanobacteriorum TaxID=2926463 RepID=UPI003BAFAA3A